MSLKASILCVASAVVLAGMVPVSAHHAVSAEFDSTKPITIKGTIKRDRMDQPAHLHQRRGQGTRRHAWSSIVSRERRRTRCSGRAGGRTISRSVRVVTVNGIRAKAADSMNVGQATITTADGRKIYGQGAGGGAK